MTTPAILLLLMPVLGTEPVRPALKPFLKMPATATGAVPRRLSETGTFADVRPLVPTEGLIPYEINVSFWSDGADKRRWIALPAGTVVRVASTGEWEFPTGTVFVKHFHFGGRRIETRLLVRAAEGGVYGASYRWRDDDSDADLVTTSHRADIAVPASRATEHRPWFFPGPDDCRKCHTPAVGVLGVNTRQINRDGPAGGNQLVAWSAAGLLAPRLTSADVTRLPRLFPVHDESIPLKERARSYLDANCSFCHRPGGAAADFDARFGTPLGRQLLIDAPSRINLGVDRARQVASNDPWRSMVLARMQMHGQTGMPPLAHETVDQEGVELLRRWIASLPGTSTVAPPTISPRSGDFREPVVVEIKHPDRDAVVRYTLDGSPPTAASTVYKGPLRLTTSKSVRARAFKPGSTPSVVATETFIVGD